MNLHLLTFTLQLYFLAKDDEAIFCGSGVHKHEGSDPNLSWEFARCEPDD